MALTTQQQYDILLEAYRSGVTEVSVDGHTVKYASRVAMRAILDEMEAELGIRRQRVTLARPNRSNW